MSSDSSLQTVMRNRKRHHPVPEVDVGRRAELHVEAMLARRLRDTPYDYFAGLRVPHRGRRREIDFVVTAPGRLWVVELKNWSGFVGLDNKGNVVQHRSGGRGVVEHGRLMTDLNDKERALKKHLGRPLDEVPDLRSMLVFYDRNVQLDERIVQADENIEVMRLPRLISMLPAPPDQGLFSRIWAALFGSSNERKGLPALQPAVRAALDELVQLGTWDLLALHGGQIVSGDLVDASADELNDRDRFDQLNVDVPRGLLDIFRSDLHIEVTGLQRNGDHTDFRYDFDETIRFHCAGDKKPKTFNLRDVEAISFGYVS